MAEQDSQTAENEPTGQDPAGADEAPSAPQNDVAAQLAQLQAERDKMSAELARARDEAAARRIKAKEEAEAKMKALQEQGEFKALADTQSAQIEEMRAQIAELEALKDKASRYDAWESRELEQIEAAKATLPDEARAALDAAGTLEAKRAFLNALNVKSPTARASATAGAGAAASEAKAPDFSGLRGRALADAINKDPQAFWGQQEKMAGQSGSALGRMMSRRK